MQASRIVNMKAHQILNKERAQAFRSGLKPLAKLRRWLDDCVHERTYVQRGDVLVHNVYGEVHTKVLVTSVSMDMRSFLYQYIVADGHKVPSDSIYKNNEYELGTDWLCNVLVLQLDPREEAAILHMNK